MNFLTFFYLPERPEEEVDNRTLYEKLQEQKDKKQEEWEEQHKLSKNDLKYPCRVRSTCSGRSIDWSIEEEYSYLLRLSKVDRDRQWSVNRSADRKRMLLPTSFEHG